MNLFSQIHEIVFHGKGGYDWDTIYNMPVWLRKFTFHKIQDFYAKEAEAAESAQKGSNTVTAIDSSGKIQNPNFLPKGDNTRRISYQ